MSTISIFLLPTQILMSVTVGTTCASAMPTVSTFQAATVASARQALSCPPVGPVWVSPACLTDLAGVR